MWSSHDLGWRTPKELYDYLNEEFDFTLDPCTDPDNHLGTPKFYVGEEGLDTSWDNERVFMNPPYGREVTKWIKKAFEEVAYGACRVAVILLASRTDTKWFHDYCAKGEIWFLKGRLKFSDHKDSAPFPSMLVIFRPDRIGYVPPSAQILHTSPDTVCPHCSRRAVLCIWLSSGSVNPWLYCRACRSFL